MTSPDAEPQARLLAMFGRSEALASVDRFGEAFAAKDIDAIMAGMTGDCVFESTSPPDGERLTGADAVRAAWDRLFAGPRPAHPRGGGPGGSAFPGA